MVPVYAWKNQFNRTTQINVDKKTEFKNIYLVLLSCHDP